MDLPEGGRTLLSILRAVSASGLISNADKLKHAWLREALRKLLAGGFIQGEKCTDVRYNLYVLTEKGKEKLKEREAA
jgi:DNA-binding MarR family transcriptional regulator